MAKYIIDIASPNVHNEYIVYWTYDGIETKRVSNLPKYTEPDTSEAYQRGYDDAKHECQDCQKIMTDAEQERVDKAYQQGVNDAENRKATCEFCGYVNKGQLDEPCKFCANNYINMFRPRKDNKLIRKNIKDIMDSLDCTISDFEKAIEEMKNEAD